MLVRAGLPELFRTTQLCSPAPTSSQMGKKRNRWDSESEEEQKEESAEEVEEEDDENEEDDDEAIEQIRLEAYETFLPQVKKLLGDEKPNLQLDVSEKTCLVCPTIQKFMGWKALMAHAKTIRNKRVHRHRGFHRALEEAILPKALPVGKRDARSVRMKPTVVEEKKLVHPPVVVVESAKTVEEVWRFVGPKLGMDSVDKVVQVRDEISLVVFRRDAAMQAEYLVQMLEDNRRNGRLRGHTAELKDMEVLDPEKQVVDWSIEANILRGIYDVKRAKEHAEVIKATAHKERQRVYKLEQSKEACLSSKSYLAQQAVAMEKALHDQMLETEKNSQDYEAKLDRDAKSRERSLKDLELDQERRHKQLSASLHFGNMKTENEKAQYFRLMERLQKILESGSEKAKETSQKILALMNEREEFERNLAAGEADIKVKYRIMEMELLDEEEKAINELHRKFEKERNVCLEGWLVDDNALNETASASTSTSAGPSISTQSSRQQETECNICSEDFNIKRRPRAIFTPCGHASTCVQCATTQTECPLCRTPIERHVQLLSERVY